MLALLLVKSSYNLQSVAWSGLVLRRTSGTSQNINIMRHTQRCFYVCSKISQLNYEDEIILIIAAYEFECFYDFASCIFFLSLAPQRDIGYICVYV